MLTPKFLRAHFIDSTIAHSHARWLMKAIYEFWGFCVNGGDDLKSAGGFAPISGVFTVPWSGSADTSLMASGSDGFTNVGMPFFNTVNPTAFSSSYVGMHLVVWKSGSTSTDDSIYQITQWLNSSSIRVNVLEGGTPYSASMHPSFTTRSNVNYRVINFPNIINLALTYNTSSLVVQFNGAGIVNPSQRNSQCRIKMVNGELGSPFTSANSWGFAFTLSPSGTWHGPEFSSGSFASGSHPSGSQVYATGNQPFQFFPTSSVYFSGSYINLTGSVPNTSTGSLLVGHLTGTFTPISGGIPSSSFVIPGDGWVLSGTTGAIAQFSGTFDGIEGNFTLTGSFLPVAAPDRLLFSGVYAFSASGPFTSSGVFTPTGTLLPPGFYSESIGQYYGQSNNTGYMFTANTTNDDMYITLIGAHDFLLLHGKPTTTTAFGFHLEVPQRLYPAPLDPNPLAVCGWGFGGPYANSQFFGGYAMGVAMHNPPDNTLISYRGLTRRFFGNSENNSPTNGSNGRFNGAYFNQFNNKFLFMDMILSNATAGQYQLARVRMRRVRILAPIIPAFERLGNNGEWIYLHNSIMWPWDNALLPYNLFLGGHG